ncbi:MAG: hypothetical protein K0S46_1244 [Moraxellaceae bacterium]|nr:hypothetical protein [Moraxellaceae bacterium]
MITLPFTPAQFFERFAAYHAAVGPLPLLLTALGAGVLWLVLRAPARAGRPAALFLALLWGWAGLVYHLGFFWRINPAAPLFAALCVGAALLFLRLGVRQGALHFAEAGAVSRGAGAALAVFALVLYPALGPVFGHAFPAAPSFGLPCPATLYTFGLLLMAARPVPRALLVLPTLWAGIGGSAAFLLGVTQDYALLAMPVVAAWLLLRRH